MARPIAGRPGGAMPDLAYAPHALDTSQTGHGPPTLAPARLSGWESARFLHRLRRSTGAVLVLLCVIAGFLVPSEYPPAQGKSLD